MPAQCPFEQVGIDLSSPLPLRVPGNCWIVITADSTTRYVVAAALPLATVPEVLKFFIHGTAVQHGAPRALISSCDTEFAPTLSRTYALLAWPPIALPSTNQQLNHTLQSHVDKYARFLYYPTQE